VSHLIARVRKVLPPCSLHSRLVAEISCFGDSKAKDRLKKKVPTMPGQKKDDVLPGAPISSSSVSVVQPVGVGMVGVVGVGQSDLSKVLAGPDAGAQTECIVFCARPQVLNRGRVWPRLPSR